MKIGPMMGGLRPGMMGPMGGMNAGPMMGMPAPSLPMSSTQVPVQAIILFFFYYYY